ncbi:MAG: glycosyl hydrolase 115 family protein [Firmicutes bacterium]|nr:glycosyl hydrolase 115 family protein [Bacillota bacterium]
MTRLTKIRPPKAVSAPVRYALEIFQRDFEKVFGGRPELVKEGNRAEILISYAGGDDPISGRPEAFALRFAPEGPGGALVMRLLGSDDLGIVYGLLYLSETFLGVDPFWFWAEKEPKRQDAVVIPAREYLAPNYRIRYRGWFVNDEVCLIGWADHYPPPGEVWFPVFESLLRLGGNMVIPGTDLPRHGVHWELASDMGLYITHHHAEPLGAEMFFRAYPDREPSYDRNRDLFEGLWEEAIRRQKGRKVIWTLGFRGQGDCPFWEQDPSCATPEARGRLISRVIRRQYEMVRKYVPDPVCSTYLYGEINELYRQGFLDIPEGIIKIWADNGYGKMVSRRQGNHNPRIPSLPGNSDHGPHGLYYHITFHDLQASSHLTMLGNPPEFVNEELAASLKAGADEYLLLNCGNIRPHLYLLDLVRKVWAGGPVDLKEFQRDFGRRYFSGAERQAISCYQSYFARTIPYGENRDDRAGEEFYHHPARIIIGQWLRRLVDEPAGTLIWAAGAAPFPEQVEWFRGKLAAGLKGWEELREQCRKLLSLLAGSERVFFEDNLLLQVELHLTGCKGLEAICRSFAAYREGNLPLAFVYASQAIWDYQEGLAALARSEHGKWRNFYRADWLTNIKATIYAAETLRRYLRVLGDSPDFFRWYKDYLMPENEKKIYLENTHRNPLPDDELARRLKAKLVAD